MLGTNDKAHMNRIWSSASSVATFVSLFFGRKRNKATFLLKCRRGKWVFIILLLSRTISMTSRTIAVLFMGGVNKISLGLQAGTKKLPRLLPKRETKKWLSSAETSSRGSKTQKTTKEILSFALLDWHVSLSLCHTELPKAALPFSPTWYIWLMGAADPWQWMFDGSGDGSIEDSSKSPASRAASFTLRTPVGAGTGK